MTLKELALAYSNKMHSKVPAHCRPMKTFSDKSANDLTKAIIAYAKVKDFFAERQGTEGRYRPGQEFTNIMGHKTITPGEYLPGHGSGKADIKSVIKGRLIEIEVKHGRDKLRPDQIKYKEQIERSGGVYLVVKTWDDFYVQILKYV